MKVKLHHYLHIKEQIRNSVTKQRAETHKKFLISEGRYKCLETRLVFDIAYMADLTRFVCDNIYSYADDSHLKTAYRRACLELGLL
jgi:hypothetical protein